MNTCNIISSLKAAGFKITIKHYRFMVDHEMKELIPFLPNKTAERVLARYKMDLREIREMSNQEYIYPYGGETYMAIERDGAAPISVKSVCSIEDTFNRKLGLKRCIYQIVGELEKIGVVV
jgi:hypothetical protein